MIRHIRRPVSWLMLGVFLTGLFQPLLAQDASAAATQQFMQQRLLLLEQQQQRLNSEFQNLGEKDALRREYLARLMQENQSLAARYTARLQGQPAPGQATQAPAPSQAIAPSASASLLQGGGPAPQGEEGGFAGMLKGLTGGGEQTTTELVVSLVAGLAGFYVGKMAFGFVGGIAGSILAPMLAKWIMKKVKEMRGESGPGKSAPPYGQGDGGYQPMGGQAISAHGAPSLSGKAMPAVQSASISEAKQKMDAAYLSMQQAIRGNLQPAEIARRRVVFEQWQVAYNNSLSGLR